MDTRIAYIVCLVMIGCYSSTLNRNRRQLEIDYETTTEPSENTTDDNMYYIEEISTVANFDVPDNVQHTEKLNDTDLTPEDLLLESIILTFMESDNSFENAPEILETFHTDISEPFLTSFLSQREQLNEELQNPGNFENVREKNILFDNCSDRIINTESNIQKINHIKRDIPKKDEQVSDFTRRYAAKHLDEFIQNMDILKKKEESKYYTRYAEKFTDEFAEKPDVSDKYKESTEIKGIDIESISDKPIMVQDITTKDKEPQNPGKMYPKRIPENPTETKRLIEKQKEPNEFMKIYIDSITPTPIAILEKPEQLRERSESILANVRQKVRAITETYIDQVLNKSTDTINTPEKESMEPTTMHVESISEKPKLRTDLKNPESLKVFQSLYDELINGPTKVVEILEKDKQPEVSIIHTESISEIPHMPVDDLEQFETRKDLKESYAIKDLERPREKIDAEKSEELKDFTRVYTKSITERPEMPIGILENHEESEEYIRIHTKRVPEDSMVFKEFLGMYENPSEMARRYTERFSENPIELKDTSKKQEKQREQSGISERFSEKSSGLIDASRLYEKPRALIKENAQIVPNKSSYTIDISDSSMNHRNPSDELAIPIDFLEMNEELQEFIKTHAKRVPEELIDSMGILNKQEKYQVLTGIHSETVAEKPNDLIHDLSAHEKPRILTETHAELVPEKTPYKMHIINKEKESKRMHSESMTEKPTMLMDILEKHYIPQVFAGVYAKEVSARPTEIINTMIKHNEPNGFQRTNTESISDELTIPIKRLENKETREFTRIHDIREPQIPTELEDVKSVYEQARTFTEKLPEIVSDKSTYSINISEKQKDLKHRTGTYPDSLTNEPSWRIDIFRQYENPHIIMENSNKQVSQRPGSIDVSNKYEEPNVFRRTYIESIADKVSTPMDHLGNTRVPEKITDVLSAHENPREPGEPHAEIVPDKSSYTIDASEKQNEFNEYTRTYPESISNQSKMRMHEEPMTFTGVYAKEISDRPHEFSRTYIESQSDKSSMPTHGLRNEGTLLNKQEKLREFTRIYTEKVLEKLTELSDVSSVHQNPRGLTHNHAKIVPEKSTHTFDVSEQQKEFKKFTNLHPEAIQDEPTRQTDITGMHQNPQGFARIDTKEAPDRPLSVTHKEPKEPNEFTRTYIERTFDEHPIPIDLLRKHEESSKYSKLDSIKVPEKPADLKDSSSVYVEPRAAAEFNPRTVPNKSIYAIDVSEIRSALKEGTRIDPETISDKLKMRIPILRKHEEPMTFTGVYAKELSDKPIETIDVSEKWKIPHEFTRTSTESRYDKLTMPAHNLKNEEATHFARIQSINIPEASSEIVDVYGVHQKPQASTKINAQVVPDKITYPIDLSEKRELKESTGIHSGSLSNEARTRIAFLEKYKKPREYEGLHSKEVSTRPTQTMDVSENHNKQKVFNKMYTEGISDNPTMPIDVLGTHEEPTEFTKMNTNRVPEKLTMSIDDMRNQAKLRDFIEIFARRASEKPTAKTVAVDRHGIPNAYTTYTEGVAKKPTGTEDILQSHKPSKEFRDTYVEKFPYKTTETPVYYSKLPAEKTAGKNSQDKLFGTVYQENYSDKNGRENSKDVDSSVENGPTYIGLGLQVPYFEKNNSKRQSFFRSSLRRANSTIPSAKVDTHRLTPDLLDELEPLPSLEFMEHVSEDELSGEHDDNNQESSFAERNSKNQSSNNSSLRNTTSMRTPPTYLDMYRLSPDHFDKIEAISPLEPLDDEYWDNFSGENQDKIVRPSFIVKALSAAVSLFMSLRRSSSEIYEIFGRLFE